MRDISERVSYLQGLSEGLNITEGSPQGKIISGILNVMNEMAEEITDIQREFADMREYIESLDDDLLDLEESVRDDDYIELECGNCGEQVFLEADIVDDEYDIEVTCPRCNEVIYINDGSFDHQHIPADEEFEAEEFHPS
ncbi:MAG: AraC family transcriptional regulator [Syntrophomonas sp.]|nr:AraC family transcriptional regulator [Syntrophomonas sp.]